MRVNDYRHVTDGYAAMARAVEDAVMQARAAVVIAEAERTKAKLPPVPADLSPDDEQHVNESPEQFLARAAQRKDN